MEVKTVGVASDHAGFPMKQFVLQYLEKKGYPVKDYGTYSDESVTTQTSVMHLVRVSRAARFILVSVSAVVARVSP